MSDKVSNAEIFGADYPTICLFSNGHNIALFLDTCIGKSNTILLGRQSVKKIPVKGTINLEMHDGKQKIILPLMYVNLKDFLLVPKTNCRHPAQGLMSCCFVQFSTNEQA